MINTKKTPTNQQLLDYGFLGQSQLVGKYLQNTQENQLLRNHDKISSSNNSKLSNIMKTILPNWEDQSVAKAQDLLKSPLMSEVSSNISDIPTFYHIKEEARHTDYGLPLSEVAAIFSRKAKRVYDRVLLSTNGERTLAKADEFGIEYDVDEVDFLTLFDQVQEFERVVAQADDLHIDWQDFGYDIIAIEQEIEDVKDDEHNHRQYECLDFFDSRGLAR